MNGVLYFFAESDNINVLVMSKANFVKLILSLVLYISLTENVYHREKFLPEEKYYIYSLYFYFISNY